MRRRYRSRALRARREESLESLYYRRTGFVLSRPLRARRNPPLDARGAGVLGFGAAFAIGGIGAAVGAASNKPCAPGGDLGNLFCGSGWGAVKGWLVGLLVAGIGGAGLAAYSGRWRQVGLWMSAGFAAATGATFAAAWLHQTIKRANAQPAPQTPSGATAPPSTTPNGPPPQALPPQPVSQ